MKELGNKRPDEFSRNEKKAFQIAMKASSRRNGITRMKLCKLLKREGVYSKKRDRKEVIQMLIHNSYVPLKYEKGKIVNELDGEVNA